MPHILDEELYQAGMALAACPTAPCHETFVRNCVFQNLKNLPHVITERDEFGNLHATYDYRSADREPVRLVAHMDHPGFIVRREKGAEELHFAGGVEESYFVGKRIVFYNEESRKMLGRAVITGTAFFDEVKQVVVEGKIPPGATFAMWDLPRARCTQRLFVAPACDDLVQVATMLALVRRLSLNGAHAHVHALFTRAEEIGFAGAMAALKTEVPLMLMPTLSLEISKARGFAKIGGGPIVRVGDKLSIFDSKVTHWLETAFRDLQAARPQTVFQRLLMGGGTCEASVFHRAALPTGALCIALNNYHNMGPRNALRSESVALQDWQGLYDFLFFLATEATPVREADAAVAARFEKLEVKALAALR